MERLAPSPKMLKKLEFTRTRRQIRAMQRQGIEPPDELMNRCLEADKWLTLNMYNWHSNFGFTKEELLQPKEVSNG